MVKDSHTTASKPTKTPKKAIVKSKRKTIPTEKVFAAKKAAAKKTPNKSKALAAENSEDVIDTSDEEDIESEEEQAKSTSTMSIDWSDVSLSESLVACIMEDRDIKRALYPPVGPNASTAKGGGKTKIAAQWKLCLQVLGEHPKYKDALAAVTTAKERSAYANKFKNRLRNMAKETRGYMSDMGETGAGIRSADEIDTSVVNTFTTLWDKISARAPWFFDMRNLIAQRPNLVPTGLGHSDTGFDADVMSAAPFLHAPASEGGTAPLDEGMDLDPGGYSLSLSQIDDLDSDTEMAIALQRSRSDADYQPAASDGVMNGDDDLETEGEEGMSKKSKKIKGKQRTGKTAAKPGTSLPTPPAAASALPTASKKSRITEFAEIAKNEEVTRQKELDLATIRAEQALRILEMKGVLGAQREERRREDRRAKREERLLKMKMTDLKLQRAHELRMASLASGNSAHSHAANPFDHRHSASSRYVSSEYAPSDMGEFPDTFGSISTGAGSTDTSSDFTLPSYKF